MTGWAVDLKTSPGFVVSDVLTTLRAGEFHVGHSVLNFGKGLNGR
jgi:hypothetical protein